MSDARDAILGSIRVALRDIPQAEEPDHVPVPRVYLRDSGASQDVVVNRFAERIAEYRATVYRADMGNLRATLTDACRRQRAQRMVVPPDLPSAWSPDGVELVPDDDLHSKQLDALDGVLTGCSLAIAQTGTIVLDGGPGQGRRAITLVPDYHLCVVRSQQIVDLVPEAISLLRATAHNQARPITLISGPSATSDIELNRVEGVHGPRTLDVVIVDN